MKIKYLFFVLAVFSVFLGLSLFLGKEVPLQVITSPTVYSFKHTELHEQFTVSVLMNQNDTYHLDVQYIEKSIIKEGENHMPISIDLIQVTKDRIQVEEDFYYLVNFVVSLQIEMNDHLIEYQDAELEIMYVNDFRFEWYIGEFNYVFDESEKDLSIYNLHGTFGEVNEINTVTGVLIDLYNLSDQNLIISRMDVLSQDVAFNNDYLIEKDRNVDLFEEVEDIVLVDSYEFESYESFERQHSILSGQSKRLYIPMLYNSDIKHITRFVIVVSYQMNGETKELYIDDFIFMNQTSFGPAYQMGYETYTYENHGL